jgi:uncharacterized membrane protein
MAETAPDRAPGAPLWMKIVLALSLGVNLVALGTVAGRIARADPERAIPFNSLGLRYVIRTLPEDDRAAFAEAAAELHAIVGPARARIAEDRKHMIALVGAESFDAGAMRALLRDQSARLAAATVATGDRLIDTLAALGPEARRRFAEALGKPRDRARRRDGSAPAPAE